MIHWLHDKIAYGAIDACTHSQDYEFPIVHACKEPCHRKAVGYEGRKLSQHHPHYLCKEVGSHLYLNMIDPAKPLFLMETFTTFLRFVDYWLTQRDGVLIHCNKGRSRSQTLALLYMAKRLKVLPDNWTQASTEFKKRNPVYYPGLGIQAWMAMNWDKIV